MNISLSGYSKVEGYVNNKKVKDATQAFDYDGKTLSVYSNNDGDINYERLNNNELMGLLDVSYESHKKPFMKRLQSDLMPRRRSHTKKRRSRKASKSKRSKTRRVSKKK